jgi:peptide/nickel transport system ATP-binding protein
VLYAGRLAEIGPVRDVVKHPQHPYTQGLMAAIPSLAGNPDEKLAQIPGSMPRLGAIPPGCAFNPRCDFAFDRCRAERPNAYPAGATEAACFLHDAKTAPPPDVAARAAAAGIRVAGAPAETPR